jgi:hypothetical protein
MIGILVFIAVCFAAGLYLGKNGTFVDVPVENDFNVLRPTEN